MCADITQKLFIQKKNKNYVRLVAFNFVEWGLENMHVFLLLFLLCTVSFMLFAPMDQSMRSYNKGCEVRLFAFNFFEQGR